MHNCTHTDTRADACCHVANALEMYDPCIPPGSKRWPSPLLSGFSYTAAVLQQVHSPW